MFIAFLIMAIMLFAVGSAAMAEGQTNPRRKHVEETIQWRDTEKRRDGLFLASPPALTVTCNRTPTLTTPGKFTVKVNSGDTNTEWAYEYGICDTARDPGGYIYFSNNPTLSNKFEDFTFWTSGEYRLYVFLYKVTRDTKGNISYIKEIDSNNIQIRCSIDFTVADTDDHLTLEEKAQEIVNECRAGSTWQTALNLHDWLTKHTYYDLNFEYFGADVLFRGKGVCDSYSKAFKLLCNTAGITAERVTSNEQNHAWNALKIGSTWYQVDVTWDDPSGGTAAVSGKEHYVYYCLSDDVMFLDHTRRDVSFDPGCPSMAMNYYIKKNKWQTFGKYDSGGNTVMGYFQNALDQGVANPVFYLSNWDFYWPSGDTGYSMGGPVRYAIYVTGMKQTDWVLNGEPLLAEIGFNYDDGYVSLEVRWRDVVETGTLTLPLSTETIDEGAFEGIQATTVVIPYGCTEINSGAFRNSGVRTVYVPETVTVVADDAFEGCDQIIFILDAVDSDFADYAKEKGHLVVEP